MKALPVHLRRTCRGSPPPALGAAWWGGQDSGTQHFPSLASCVRSRIAGPLCPQIGGHHWDLPQVALGVTGVIELVALVCCLQDPGAWEARASVVWVFLC